METAPISFEQIIEDRVSFGSYQKTIIFLMSFIIMSDGIEISALSIILPILKTEWGVSEDLQGLMGSILFFGILVGSLLNGFLTDKIGRKQSLTYISFIQFLLGIFSAFIDNLFVFIIIRGIFGILLGFVVPLVPALVVEWTPTEKRGKILVIVTSFFSFGQLLSIIIAWFCLKDLGEGNWRLMLIICSFPLLLVWFGCYKFLLESPRYTMIYKDISSGIDILNEVILYNERKSNLGFGSKARKFSLENDYAIFKNWIDIMKADFLGNTKENFFLHKLKEILHGRYLKITIGLWTAWFCINFAAYGILFILPFLLDEIEKGSVINQKNGLLTMFITTLGEASSGFLAYFIIEIPQFGRKNSLIISQAITAICTFFLFVLPITNNLIVIGFLTISRFFAKVCFTFIYPLTAEIYPTIVRTMGLGSSSAFGRVSACLMPFILIKLFYINIYYPFGMIFLFSLLGILGTYMIPYDTRGRYLDVVKENEVGQELLEVKEELVKSNLDRKL